MAYDSVIYEAITNHIIYHMEFLSLESKWKSTCLFLASEPLKAFPTLTINLTIKSSQQGLGCECTTDQHRLAVADFEVVACEGTLW